MNIRIIQSMLSRILLGAGAVLLLPLLLSLYYGGPVLFFLIPALLSLLLYLLLRRRNLSPNVSLTPREGTAPSPPFPGLPCPCSMPFPISVPAPSPRWTDWWKACLHWSTYFGHKISKIRCQKNK